MSNKKASIKEAEANYKENKDKIKRLLDVYDMFEFQYQRFADENCEMVKTEDEPEFFGKFATYIQRAEERTGVELAIANDILMQGARTIPQSTSKREDYKKLFGRLVKSMVHVMAGLNCKFMRPSETSEQLVNCIALEHQEQEEDEVTDIMRRGLVYQNGKYVHVIRYQEVKIYKKK